MRGNQNVHPHLNPLPSRERKREKRNSLPPILAIPTLAYFAFIEAMNVVTNLEVRMYS
jgi:hypothetical protein